MSGSKFFFEIPCRSCSPSGLSKFRRAAVWAILLILVVAGHGFPGPTRAQEAPPPNSPSSPSQVPKQCPECEARACESLGGKWQSGTLAVAGDIAATMDQQISQCAKSSEVCAIEKSSHLVQGYMDTLPILQCHIQFMQSPDGKTEEDIDSAIKEACGLEESLNGLLAEVHANGISILPLHYSFTDQPDMDTLCDCVPDPPDFEARLDELRKKAEQDLIKEFAG